MLLAVKSQIYWIVQHAAAFVQHSGKLLHTQYILSINHNSMVL